MASVNDGAVDVAKWGLEFDLIHGFLRFVKSAVRLNTAFNEDKIVQLWRPARANCDGPPNSPLKFLTAKGIARNRDCDHLRFFPMNVIQYQIFLQISNI